MTIKIVGIPFDDQSSFLNCPALAPAVIRQQLHNGASNYTAENGIDIIADATLTDESDLPVSNYNDISTLLFERLQTKDPILFLGGDHSITFPIVQFMHSVHGKFDILHIDAHSDLYDQYEGNKFSHACPFARIMENGLANHVTQVGIRTLNKHQEQQAEKFGVEIISMQKLKELKKISFNHPLYISIDMDGFDPAFAPGVSHHEPGGLSSRFVINLLHSLRCKIIGADIVEFNPTRDVQGITAALVAKLLKEVASVIAKNDVA